MLSISMILKKTGHQIFINILTVIGVSFGWSLFIVPAIFILPIHLAILFLTLTFVPATVAVYALMNYMLNGGKKRFGQFFAFFGYYFKRSSLLSLVFSIAVIIPASEWWYYLNENNSYLVFIFAVFQTYLCLTFLSSQVYTIPFLVIEDLPVIKAMNKSIRHFLSHTWYTIGLFMQVLSVTVLLSLSVIGFFFLYIGMMAVFVLNSTKNLAFDKKKTTVVMKAEQPI